MFGRFARKERISADALWDAVERAEKGQIDAIIARYREIAEPVDTAPIEEAALRDPNDAAVLACALAARAEAIISGDHDLHALGNYQGIPVLSPADCLKRLAA